MFLSCQVIVRSSLHLGAHQKLLPSAQTNHRQDLVQGSLIIESLLLRQGLSRLEDTASDPTLPLSSVTEFVGESRLRV